MNDREVIACTAATILGELLVQTTFTPSASDAKHAAVGSVLESASMLQPMYWTLSALLRAEPIEP
jgi:hypothetical protein